MATSAETFDVLRQDIVSGRYQPMHLFDPRQLSEEYFISVAPVREAMLRLSERGLLRWERNRGFFVEKISSSTALFHLDQLRAHYIYSINRLSENEAMRSKVSVETLKDRRPSDVETYRAWHASVLGAVFSDVERDFIQGIWDRIWLYRNHYLKNDSIRSNLCKSSRDLTIALVEHDYAVCAEHIDTMFRYVMKIFPEILCSMRD
ncbi:hypothetical protein N185_15665 [Sinorhizobium sp. GW3]|nr:hypothetical protein N185_15665 [Sinorhizobium sp. GW3]